MTRRRCRFLLHALALVVVATAAVTTGGCAGSTSPVAFMPPAPPPAQAEYRVQGGDTLQLKFYYHPDHDQEVVVRSDGKLLLPLIGEVQAAGQKPDELALRLEQAYSNNLRAPRIAVLVKTMNENRVYVGGEVNRPGFVTFRTGLTAVQAMIEVGGPKDTARVDEVVLLQKAGGETYRASKINLSKVLDEGDPSADLALAPSDVIFVPKSSIAKLNQFVDQYIIKVLPIRPTLGIPLL